MREGIQCGCYKTVNCISPWSVVYSFSRFCWKTFLKQKQTEQNGDKHTCICPMETLVCNCWTNDCTHYQLNAGKSAQGGIECHCLSMCHIKCVSRPVCTTPTLQTFIHRLGCSNLMMGIGKIKPIAVTFNWVNGIWMTVIQYAVTEIMPCSWKTIIVLPHLHWHWSPLVSV
jgi:hypothetical protein